MNHPLVEKVLGTNSGLAGIALRLPAGIIFAAHGSQKLFGAFGGYGLEGTGQWMASIGLEPGYLMALAAGSAEFLGGIAILVGVLTRPAALVLAFTMLVAILSVHIQNGLFMSNNGYEFGLSLMAMAVALVFNGAGAFSVDRWISNRNSRSDGSSADAGALSPQ
jgi:putative oxidoreductase